MLDFWLLQRQFPRAPFNQTKAAVYSQRLGNPHGKTWIHKKIDQDQHSDTGIRLTPEEFLIKPSNLGDTPNTTSKENVTSATEVSDLPFISSDDASPRPKITEISLSKTTDTTENNTRSRTLTAKGQEYYSGLKKTAVLAKDRELRTRIGSFEELVHSGRDISKLKKGNYPYYKRNK